MATRPRTPRHLRGDTGAKRVAAGRGNRMEQSVSGRRLDRDRPAGDDRKRHPFRPSCGRPDRPSCQGCRMSVAATADPRELPRELDRSIEAGTQALLACQQSDGHWVFELEADATIPAEYVLLRHYRGEP